MTITRSWRYGVMGIYRDRRPGILHVYPLPFVRLTITWGAKS
jgi:hypothetical protein